LRTGAISEPYGQYLKNQLHSCISDFQRALGNV
jgi:hypothetical protein